MVSSLRKQLKLFLSNILVNILRLICTFKNTDTVSKFFTCTYAQIINFLFFFSFIFISWRLITLQYCSGFCHTLTWISHGFTCVPPPDPPSHFPSHPSGSSRYTSPEHLSHASNLGWQSDSHLIIYMFQCYSLRSSHPRLLPQSPKVCSIDLCLLFWLSLPSF